MRDINLIQPGFRQCEIERIFNIGRRHPGAELPGDDVSREVVQHGGEIEPAPTDHFEIGKVGLPQLVRRSGFIFELIVRRSLERMAFAPYP